MRRVQRIRQAVQLRHLLEWRQQTETHNIEQRHGPARHVVNAVFSDHLFDDLGLDRGSRKRFAQRYVDRLDFQQARDFLHLGNGQLPIARNQLGDEARRNARCHIVRRDCRVFRNRVVRDDEDQDALVELGPAKDTVLAEGPMIAQRGFQMRQITALPQAHLLSQSGQLIEVRRIIGYSSNPRLRQIF